MNTVLHLQCRAPGGAWDTLATAPVIDRPGMGIDAAHAKLKATRERYKGLGVLDPGADYRIIRAEEPEVAGALVTAVALAMIGAAIALYAGIAAHVI